MALRIAFDLDGVLADMEGALVREWALLFDPKGRAAEEDDESSGASEAVGDEEPPAPNLTKLSLSPRQRARLWRHVCSLENFWETLEPIEPAVISRLAKLATDNQWEIIFLTRRPRTRGATAQVQTQRWLQANGFDRPSVFVVQGSRGAIAASLDLDVVVDDRLENCMDVVVDSKARAILVWRDDARQLPAAVNRFGVGVVPSVDECLDILVEIDTPAPDQPGKMTQLLRRLGLKEPALD